MFLHLSFCFFFFFHSCSAEFHTLSPLKTGSLWDMAEMCAWKSPVTQQAVSLQSVMYAQHRHDTLLYGNIITAVGTMMAPCIVASLSSAYLPQELFACFSVFLFVAFFFLILFVVTQAIHAVSWHHLAAHV